KEDNVFRRSEAADRSNPDSRAYAPAHGCHHGQRETGSEPGLLSQPSGSQHTSYAEIKIAMTASSKPTVIVTGISGNLGRRLLRLLDDFQVIGVDFAAPQTDMPIRFEK